MTSLVLGSISGPNTPYLVTFMGLNVLVITGLYRVSICVLEKQTNFIFLVWALYMGSARANLLAGAIKWNIGLDLV